MDRSAGLDAVEKRQRSCRRGSTPCSVVRRVALIPMPTELPGCCVPDTAPQQHTDPNSAILCNMKEVTVRSKTFHFPVFRITGNTGGSAYRFEELQ